MDHIIEIERKHNGHVIVYVDKDEPMHLMTLDTLDAKAQQNITNGNGEILDSQTVRVIVNPIG